MPVQVTADKLTNFPDELKQLPRWVVWKMETRDGKQTKILYSPVTHRRASSTDPATWARYGTAVTAAPTHGYAGVGCVIADPYVAVDLDKCRDAANGVAEPWAEAMIQDLNSYTELSPSGRGFHIWLRGKVPADGNRKGRVEMYDNARYFTVTGEHVEGTPLTIEARDLTALHARMMAGKLEAGTAAPAPMANAVPTQRPSRDDLVACWQNYFPSQSEADFALCVLLAGETGGDPARIDAAFRATALFRPKWDEKHGAKTYGTGTIERAIEHWHNKGGLCTIVEDEPAAAPLVPVYPAHVIDGDYIGDLTHILTDGTAIPPPFVRENVKAILGATIDGRVGFPGHDDLHTRLYAVNVSLHPRTGKFQAWKRTGEFPTGLLVNLLTHCGVAVVDGGRFGSGEYMTSALSALEKDRSPSHVLARFDEMVEPFEKAKATGSTLESKLLQLYERNSISSGSFKNGEYEVKDTHLSLCGDFVRDTFLTTFEGRGSGGSGFLARCTLALADKIYHAGDWVPTDKIAADKVVTNITLAADTFRSLGQRFIPEESRAARDLRYDFFEHLRAKEDPRYTPELEAHFKRDLLMRTLFSGDTRIDAVHVQKSIVWTLHQLELRNELWPVDAGGPVERAEQRIVKVLGAKGTLSLTRLIDFCNVKRGGSGGFEAFNRALRALTQSQVLRVVAKSQRGSPIYALEGGLVA